MPSSRRASGATRDALNARVLSALVAAALGQAACLPLDDLSSYSSAWQGQPDVIVEAERPDAAGDVEVPGDGGAASNDPDAGLDASSPMVPTPDAGAAEATPDAGEAPAAADDGGTPLDAGAPDAAS
jgi:hypothetical protein